MEFDFGWARLPELPLMFAGSSGGFKRQREQGRFAAEPQDQRNAAEIGFWVDRRFLELVNQGPRLGSAEAQSSHHPSEYDSPCSIIPAVPEPRPTNIGFAHTP
jgi:hypothetical protein